MKKIMLSGSNGFVGQRLIRYWVNQGYEVIGLLRSRHGIGEALMEHPKVRYFEVDYFNLPGIFKKEASQSYFVHVAAQVRASKSTELYKSNVELTRSLYTWWSSVAPENHFIFISSAAAAGPNEVGREEIPRKIDEGDRPVSLYGASKLAAENKLKAFIQAATSAGLKTAPLSIFRPVIVYGPQDHGMLPLFQSVSSRLKPLMNAGALYSVVNVNDVARIITLSLGNEQTFGKTFYLAHPKTYTMAQILQGIANVLKKKPVPFYIPVVLAKTLAQFSDGLNRRFNLNFMLTGDKVIEGSQTAWNFDGQTICQTLNTQYQVDLEEGLAETAAWYLKKKWLK